MLRQCATIIASLAVLCCLAAAPALATAGTSVSGGVYTYGSDVKGELKTANSCGNYRTCRARSSDPGAAGANNLADNEKETLGSSTDFQQMANFCFGNVHECPLDSRGGSRGCNCDAGYLDISQDVCDIIKAIDAGDFATAGKIQ